MVSGAEVKERLKKLHEMLKKEEIDYYLIPTADFHNSEYVGDYFKVREHFSGFTGSNGTLIVSEKEDALWTDGRYFIQAASEIEGTGVKLMKMGEEGVPTTVEYLSDKMKDGETLGFDGRVVSCELGVRIEKALAGRNINIRYDKDIADSVWTDRPALPVSKVRVLPENICGFTAGEKIGQIREDMKKKNCGRYVLSKLDDIMWLLNIRGGDIECNPVALSYFVLTSDAAFLFIREREVTDALKDHLAKYSVTLRPYEEAGKFLAAYSRSGKTLFDGLDTSYSFYNTIKSRSEYVDAMNPTSIRKAVKNPTELENIRRVYIEDSATLTKFIFWLKKNAGKTPLTEYSAAMRLDGMRAKIKGFMDLSFPTISAYNANAAMMHYEATENDCADIKAEGMLLVDSGGQYLGGTTDVTRTIVLGKISDETKKHFTKVAIGMLNLANTHFLYGCSGRNVDIMAREPLWELGIDYKCGTGHGIGYILNVHEGPQNIRWHYNIDQPEATLEEGMIVSDEPGVYLEGKYGIRTENILEIKKGVKNGDGQFMHFDMLTYVPIDKDAIDVSVMEDKDIERLNAYHKAVYEKLHPFMTGEDEEMLKAATAPVSRS